MRRIGSVRPKFLEGVLGVYTDTGRQEVVLRTSDGAVRLTVAEARSLSTLINDAACEAAYGEDPSL